MQAARCAQPWRLLAEGAKGCDGCMLRVALGGGASAVGWVGCSAWVPLGQDDDDSSCCLWIRKRCTSTKTITLEKKIHIKNTHFKNLKPSMSSSHDKIQAGWCEGVRQEAVVFSHVFFYDSPCGQIAIDIKKKCQGNYAHTFDCTLRHFSPLTTSKACSLTAEYVECWGRAVDDANSLGKQC